MSGERSTKGRAAGGQDERRGEGGRGRNAQKERKEHEVLNTIVFDSKGPRKYAVQLRKAGNGNPCLKIIEGIPTGDTKKSGANAEQEYRRVYLTVWSEDFDAFFKAIGDTWRYIRDHDVKTPDDHKTPKHMPPPQQQQQQQKNKNTRAESPTKAP